MTLLRRIVPYPILSLLAFSLWLALNDSVEPGQILLGGAIALVIPKLTERFWADRPTLVRPLAAVRLFLVFLYDVLTANWTVARQVLGPLERLRSDFVEVPLDLRDPFVATILGGMVSMTPGTVSVDIDRERWVLLVHSLDIADADALVRTIKTRYEKPLMEMMSCSATR